MATRPDSPNPKPRRVYATVGLAQENGDFTVALDGRAAKTPGGGRLSLPTHRLAEAIGAEWDAQSGVIDFASMPLTRLAFTALDRGAGAQAAMALAVARQAETDALCYFADGPPDLLARQTAHWIPVLDWAADALALPFVRTTGIMHKAQPPQTVAGVAALAQALDVFNLTGLAFAAALFQSAILALAVQRQMLSGPVALELSRLDEAYQEQRWGVDAEAAKRTAALGQDAVALQAWFEALAPL
jgi:chaperone required for assembly of F1-ATPase